MSDVTPQYYSVTEVAQMTRLDKRTIVKLCREGKFGAVKFGKQWRIPRRHVDVPPTQEPVTATSGV